MDELNEFFAHIRDHSANRIDLIMETELDDRKFYFNYSTPIDICRVLGSIKSDAVGSDVLRGLLKLIASYILPILEHIYNSLMHEVFPA